MRAQEQEQGRRGVALLVAGLAVLNALAFTGVGPLDDDFIFYRYASNLVEHGQLAFNVGELVEGYVAPLWVLVLAGTTALGIAAPIASQVLGVLSAAGTAYLLARLWQRRRPGGLPLPALLFASLPAVGYHARSGLGTMPAALLVIAWASCWERALARGGRALSAGLLLGGAVLLRPELLVLALPFGAVELRRRRPAALLAALAPVLAWSAFRWWYYGEWLPNPYYVKRLALADELDYGWRYLAGSLGPGGWSPGATFEVGAGVWLGIGIVQAALGFGSRGAAAARRDPFLRAVLLGWLAHGAAVVLLGGDFMPFARLFLPTLPLALLCVWHLVESLRAARPQLALLVGVLLFLVPQGSQLMRRGKGDDYAFMEGRWQAVGRALAEVSAPADRIATSPIGCIGYYARRPIVDILGLTTGALRDVAPDLAITMKGHHRHDGAWVLSREPELFVPSNAQHRLGTPFVPLRWELDLILHPGFVERYRPIELPVPGSYPLVLYQRRDLALLPGAREITGSG